MQTKELNQCQRKILETLSSEGPLSYEELAEKSGYSYDGVRGRIAELAKSGYQFNKYREGRNTFVSFDPESDLDFDTDELDHEITRTPERIISKIQTMSDVVKTRNNSIRDYNKVVELLTALKQDTKFKSKTKTTKSKDHSNNINNSYGILVLSDIHFGEIIMDGLLNEQLYNTTIGKGMMNGLQIDIIHYLNREKIKDLKVFILGDTIDGDSIYKNQAFRIEKPAVEQIRDAVESISKLIKNISNEGITVDVHCIRGNHGISNYNNVVEDNWDNIVYDMLELIFNDNDMVTINHYKTNEALIELPDRKAVILHGDDLNEQIKTSSGLKQFRGICGKYKLDDGDLVFAGHYHTFGIEIDQNKMLIRNGSVAPASEYALGLHLYTEPEQTLLLFDCNNLTIETSYPTIVPLSPIDMGDFE